MKPKWHLFLIVYSLFYAWLNVSWVWPVTWLQYQRGWWWNLRDYALWVLPALLPYLILLRFYIPIKLFSIPIVLLGIIASHVLRCSIVYGSLPWQAYFSKNAHLFFSISLFGIVWFFVQSIQYYDQQKTERLSRIRAAELLFLRGQVSPHFLFNSLNNCYGLVFEHSPKALNAVRSLTSLIKYSYQDLNASVPVLEELKYIHEYIALQQLRYDPLIPIEWKTEGCFDHVRIHPLLLIPFVENAFKHGNLKKGFTLQCSIKDKLFSFRCCNEKSSTMKDRTPGIGLTNVRRRLELIYPEKHLLEISNNSDSFQVNLSIHV